MTNPIVSYQGCYQVKNKPTTNTAPAIEKIMADVELYTLEAKCDALRHKFDQIPTSSPELKNAIGQEFKTAYAECIRARQAFHNKYGGKV